MIETLKTTVATGVFWLGYYWYGAFGKTPWYSYLSLRKLFYTSNTQFNKKLSSKIAKRSSTYSNLEPIGVLGKLTNVEVGKISALIQQDGYYIFENTLDETAIERLVKLSLRTKAKLTPVPESGVEWGYFDRSNPVTIKYQYMEGEIIQDETVQSLMADQSILAIAQSFLGARPILDLISMWWSTAISKTASSEVAQLYHWDMERIKFVKFFFYLTDVNTHNGPHCFVKGSNNGFPPAVRRDGRVSDNDINMAYEPDSIIEITGKRGTIIAVDTSGFHKGKKLEAGDRLLLQFEFSNSLFGVNSEYHSIHRSIEPLQRAASLFPFVYQRYTKK